MWAMSNMFNPKSFKFRMTGVVSLLVLTASFLVATVSLFTAERKMAEVIGDQQYALLTSAAASIDEDLDSKKVLLKTVAEELSGHVKLDAQKIQEVFESHLSLRDEFFNAVAFNAKGNLVVSLSDRKAAGTLNVSTRDYFQETVAAKEGVISAPFLSRLSGKPVVLITEPIFDATGKLLFVIAGGMDLHRPRLFAQLESLAPGKSGYLFLVTNQGTILQHPNLKRILVHVGAEPGLGKMFNAMRSVDAWARGYTEQGYAAIWTFHRLRNADWIIGSAYPEYEAFAPLESMRVTALLASSLVAVLAGALGWLAIFRLLRPLGALRRHVSKISSGHSEIDVFNVQRKDEFGELSRAFYDLSQQRQKAEEHLSALAKTDMLTGINNRRMFDETLQAALGRASRNYSIVGLAYLDIDHFKMINDTWGHGIGDEVLIEFAARLHRSVRVSDTVARLAGDEFVVIFEQLSDESVPYILGNKILASVRDKFNLSDVSLHVTTSIGIALTQGLLLTATELVAAADKALYQAKQAGRNCFSVSHSEHNEVLDSCTDEHS